MNQPMKIIDANPSDTPERLYRSRTERQVAGVCGGLGEFLGIDPTLIRILWLASVLLGGAGFFAYIVMAILIPEESEEHAAQKVTAPARGANFRAWVNSDKNRGLLWGAALVAIGLLFLMSNFDVIPLRQMWQLFWRLFWPMLLIGIGILMLLGISGRGVDWRGVVRGDRRLHRSRTDRMIGGVCGGLGEYLAIDPTLIRVAWAALSLSTIGVGVMLYILALIVIPETPDDNATPPNSNMNS